MKVIGAAESVNKCKRKKNCDDTWNLLAEILGALEEESTSDIKDATTFC